MAGPQNSSIYWSNTIEGQRLREEYGALLEGRVPAPPEQVTEANDTASRIDRAFADAGVDTGELELSFLGLSTEVQGAVVQLLEGDRNGVLDLPQDGLDEFCHFVDAMTPEEWEVAQSLIS